MLCSRHVIRTLEAAMTLTVAATSQRHAAGAIAVIPTGRALGAEVRGVDLRDLDEAAFARLMQETGRRFVEGLPEIYIVSNVKVNGEPIGSLGDGEAVWHTDMSYLDVPPKASMLYSLEVPRVGGNTSFCTMYGIYEALPQELKDRVAGLKIKHDGTYNSGGYLRQGVTPTDDPITSPGAVHPLVCIHPDTGRRMLYLGRRRNAYL